MRLPSGEVELITSSMLERAFNCGLADARTPVRSFAAHTWITLQEAANLEFNESPFLASVAPEAPLDLDMDLQGGARWQVRDEEIEVRAVKASRLPAIGAVITVVALAATLVMGISLQLDGNVAAAHAAAAPVPATHRSTETVHEHVHPQRTWDTERFTDEQKKRLHEIDFKHRWEGFGLKGHASPVVSPSEKAFTPPSPHAPAPAAAPTSEASRWDPLDGRL